MLPLMAQVLATQGKEGFTFRSDDGLDEVSLSASTTVLQISNGKVTEFKFDPAEIGIERSHLSELTGGDASENAKHANDILSGKIGAKRDAVTLNAAFAIAAFKGDFHLPLPTQIANGLVLANKAIDSGAALSVLNKWASLTNEIATAR
jgi:anthranilate phosphoribosyltransferase